MIRIKEAIVVEGKYDKIRLESVVDTVIIETNGFGIFKDKEKMALLRVLAHERGLLILTDSDSAGFVIRNFLIGSIPPEQIKHAYIPEIFGRERRKEMDSKEGLLGVEGMTQEILITALDNAGVVTSSCPLENEGTAGSHELPMTKQDLYELGLNGHAESASRRQILLEHLGFPKKMTTNRLLEVLNVLMTKERLQKLVQTLWESETSK